MTFYIDENMPALLAEAFNLLQQELNDRSRYGSIEILSIIVEFGASMPDEE